MHVFEEAKIGDITLKNRIIRSATFEGLADSKGIIKEEYSKLYKRLSKNNIGGIITGFSYIEKQGKAIHPGQAGIENEDQVIRFKKMTDEIHKYDTKIFLQIAHTGRQTMKKVTGEVVVSSSEKTSNYFKDLPKKLSEKEIKRIIENFACAALRAKNSGFDGVQIHAAHGYLIHQFILPSINDRNDKYGINKKSGIGECFLGEVVDSIKEKCGNEFPVLVKISGSDDYRVKFSKEQFVSLIQFLDEKKVEGIEISYGTMDEALNIFRGKAPIQKILDYNFIYGQKSPIIRKLFEKIILPMKEKQLIKFLPMYNLDYAVLAKKHTDLPIISVGGFRKGKEIMFAVEEKKIDFVSLCRPFIIEPDFVLKFMKDENYISKCINCNACAVMCDSPFGLKCYKYEEEKR